MSDWSRLSPDEYRMLRNRLGAPAAPLPDAWGEHEQGGDEVLDVIDHATHAVNFEIRSLAELSRGAALVAADRMVTIAPSADGGAELGPEGSDQLLRWLGRQLDLVHGVDVWVTTVAVSDQELSEVDRLVAADRADEAARLLVAGGTGTDEAARFAAAWGARTRMGQIGVVRRRTADGVEAASVDLDWFEANGRLWAVRVPLPGRDGVVGAVEVSAVELLATVAGNLAVLDWPGVPELLIDDPLASAPTG